MKVSKLLLSLLLCASVALCSCGGGSDEPTPTPTPDPEQPETPQKTFLSVGDLRKLDKGAISADKWIKASVISNRDVNNMHLQSIVVSDGTAGITLRLSAAPSTAPFEVGDEIQVPLKGTTLAVYNGLLQVQDIALTAIEKSTTKKVIAATPISVAQLLSGNYESMYVAVSDVQVTSGDLANTFSGSKGQIYMEGKEGASFALYTKSGSVFDAIKVPQLSGTIKGIASNFNAIQLLLTAKEDYAGMTADRFVVKIPDAPFYAKALELPAFSTTEDQLFVSHSFTQQQATLRNYSMLYDKKLMYPIWVAYPLHAVYIGNTDRTDDWHFDPQIPQTYQTNMFSGMGNGYDRGHMVPSGSRTVSKEANAQTFYYSNMTAQLNAFNGDRWARTEEKVRQWKGSGSDTLYVVTGAVLQTKGGNETVTMVTNRNDGKQIPVPNYYYKVLLKRDMKNGTPVYRAIGFWFDHKAAKGAPVEADLRSVDWIEEKTGLDFFTNLDKTVEKQVEASYSIADWGGL